MKLDLETLKQVKIVFDIHSDHSARCNGYQSLLKMIEQAEKEADGNTKNGTELAAFLDYNLEKSKNEKWVSQIFGSGWMAALMHVKVNFLQKNNTNK